MGNNLICDTPRGHAERIHKWLTDLSPEEVYAALYTPGLRRTSKENVADTLAAIYRLSRLTIKREEERETRNLTTSRD